MSKIIYKVAPRGEGKTSWLILKAYEELKKNETVFLLTSSQTQYDKFVNHYYSEYHERCEVKLAQTTSDVSYDSIVLIDNLLELDDNLCNIRNLSCYVVKKLYITLDGTTELECIDQEKSDPTNNNYIQLSIFDKAGKVNTYSNEPMLSL